MQELPLIAPILCVSLFVYSHIINIYFYEGTQQITRQQFQRLREMSSEIMTFKNLLWKKNKVSAKFFTKWFEYE